MKKLCMILPFLETKDIPVSEPWGKSAVQVFALERRKSLDDFNAFMRSVSKDAIETLLEEELTDHLGFEKYDQKAKSIDNSRNGYTPKSVKSKFGEIDLDVPIIF